MRALEAADAGISHTAASPSSSRVGGSAALLADPALAAAMGGGDRAPAGGPAAGEPFWKSVRDQFVMPPDLAVMNAANLCPASRPVAECLTRESQERRRATPRPTTARG